MLRRECDGRCGARWEAAQPGYQRSLWVLERVQGRLRTLSAAHGPSVAARTAACAPAAASGPPAAEGGGDGQGLQAGAAAAKEPVCSMLLCGADVVASFATPGVWREEHLRSMLRDHGVVCIVRRVFLNTGQSRLHLHVECRKRVEADAGIACSRLLLKATCLVAWLKGGARVALPDQCALCIAHKRAAEHGVHVA